MRAFVVDADGRLALQECPPPVPAASEALVRVAAVSLNRGEVTRAQGAKPGTRLGWDVAGEVEVAAADGSGPPVGTRVVGLVASRGWADRVAVPTSQLAKVPDAIALTTAASLPVAGLTALYAVRRGEVFLGSLLGRRVLVTGTTGGVGQFAARLARLSGARVTALVRSAADAPLATAAGADAVAITDGDADAARALGPYDLIIESVGGSSLARSLDMLAPRGICVVFGVSADTEAHIDARAFYMAGAKTISGLAVFEEIKTAEPAGRALALLLALVGAGRLEPPPTETRPFARLPEAAQDLLARRVRGKLILTLE
ncbi:MULTISPECIES: zinc-binding dehydrogenase [unclassified Xanthobacter]|uniref:zinc-binding dehydrogenase n=1 Tax=unclassified Xanthobacter TaxID=2623496 RepID=UPI001EE11BD6|nr:MULTISPECIES: zinc-binding dehydrogenase [unclassified Xanthobacter]